MQEGVRLFLVVRRVPMEFKLNDAPVFQFAQSTQGPKAEGDHEVRPNPFIAEDAATHTLYPLQVAMVAYNDGGNLPAAYRDYQTYPALDRDGNPVPDSNLEHHDGMTIFIGRVMHRGAPLTVPAARALHFRGGSGHYRTPDETTGTSPLDPPVHRNLNKSSQQYAPLDVLISPSCGGCM